MTALQHAITKVVKSNPKNSPAIKKSVRPQKGHSKKDVVAAKMAVMVTGRLIAKNLIMIIQVNLVPNPSEMWRRQQRIVIIKIFAINLTTTAIS